MFECRALRPPQVTKAGGDQAQQNTVARQVAEAAMNAARTAQARNGTDDAAIAAAARDAAAAALTNVGGSGARASCKDTRLGRGGRHAPARAHGARHQAVPAPPRLLLMLS